jgi:hypothetical protein
MMVTSMVFLGAHSGIRRSRFSRRERAPSIFLARACPLPDQRFAASGCGFVAQPLAKLSGLPDFFQRREIDIMARSTMHYSFKNPA